MSVATIVGKIAGFMRHALQSDFFVLGMCVVYSAIVAPFTPGFLSTSNFANILAATLPLLLVALGQTLVLITGGIDLSVTATIGLTSIVGAMAMNNETGWLANSALAAPVGSCWMLLIGAMVGTANGLAIARLRMPPFIVTLASLMAFSGLAVWLAQSKSINLLPRAFTIIGGNTAIAFVLVAVISGVVHVVLSRSLLGRWLYAIGHNRRAALVSGVPVSAVLIATYVSAGVLAAFASVIYTGQAETGSPVLGEHILLDVIGATLIGGTSLFGGKGKVLWTVFGVLFLKLIDNSLNLLNLSLFSITIAKGAVILVAAVVDSLRSRLAGPARA